MPYNRGEIVLVPFPFTDLSGRKRRPGLIVSSDAYNARQRDLILAQVSSVISSPVPSDEYQIADWQDVGLLFPSVVRPKLFTIENSLIVTTLGQLSGQEMTYVDHRLKLVLSL